MDESQRQRFAEGGALADAIERLERDRDELLAALKVICSVARETGREMPVYEVLIRRIEGGK